MSKLDEALIDLRRDMNDKKNQSEFYDLFLYSTFFLPILHDREPRDAAVADQGGREVLPLITEAAGNDYLMIFDSLERLKSWAKDQNEDENEDEDEVRYVEVPGYVLALSTKAPLHLAMNAGTEFSKQFPPDEIGWLRESVERCKAEAAGKQE